MSANPSILELQQLSVDLDREPVLFDVDLTVEPRELLALMGPNGSGKTTLLRAIAGLERAVRGRVFLDGNDITRLPPHKRGIGLLMQEPALFPHRTVLENVAYGPLVQGRPPDEAREEARSALQAVRLAGFEDRSSGALSGGERQRVALARAVAARPRLILLDEPFAAIDPEVRAELRGDFRQILSDLGIGAIHVTHDREEGLFLGDRVAVLLEGRLRAVGRPEEVVRAPRSARVARFLGYNVLASREGARAFLPRDTQLGRADGNGVEATLLASGYTGRDWAAVARTDRGERVEVLARQPEPWPPNGSRVGVRWTKAIELQEP